MLAVVVVLIVNTISFALHFTSMTTNSDMLPILTIVVPPAVVDIKGARSSKGGKGGSSSPIGYHFH